MVCLVCEVPLFRLGGSLRLCGRCADRLDNREFYPLSELVRGGVGVSSGRERSCQKALTDADHVQVACPVDAGATAADGGMREARRVNSRHNGEGGRGACRVEVASSVSTMIFVSVLILFISPCTPFLLCPPLSCRVRATIPVTFPAGFRFLAGRCLFCWELRSALGP